MGYTSLSRNHVREVLNKAKKRRCIEILSHVDSNLSKYLKLSYIYSVEIRISCYSSTLEDISLTHSLFSSRKMMDTESSVCINEQISVEDVANIYN